MFNEKRRQHFILLHFKILENSVELLLILEVSWQIHKSIGGGGGGGGVKLRSSLTFCLTNHMHWMIN